MPDEEIRPQAGPQTAFLTSEADIVIYGGAAGGGKSWALLLEAIRHIANPKYGAVFFRRMSPQITNEGGLWDEAGKIYPLVGGMPRIASLQYRWPKGGTVTFRHLQHEKSKYTWQGSQVPLLIFDELTHFSESQFFYMLSRNRSMCGVRPYVRASCNPDAGSWVKRLIGPWVDRKHKLYPTKPGVVLFFVRHQGKIVWAKSREEMAGLHPGIPPKSITFIAATIHDNKKLLEADPDYLANLEAQTTVERARLLLGDWDVCNEGLVYPDFGTIVIEPEDWPIAIQGKHVGGIDWGFRDPFAALGAIEDCDGTLWIDWERYETRGTLTAHSKAMPTDAEAPYQWWADPAGASQIAEFRLANHDVRPCVHKGQQPIKSGVTVVTERIRDRSIRIKGNLGNLIDEAGKYRYGETGDSETPIDKHNHLMDALRYLIVGHDRFQVVKRDPDETPAETAEEAQAAEEHEAEVAHRDPDSDHWYGG